MGCFPPRFLRFAGIGAIIAVSVGLGGGLAAQSLRGVGDDALTVPAGTFRVGIDATWTLFSDVYGPGGTLRPVGAALSTDSLGVRQIPALQPLQSALQSLTGAPGMNLSLGKTLVSTNNRVQSTPIQIEFGVTHWLQIGVSVPLVKTRASVFARANPAGTEGNVSVNPAQGGSQFQSATPQYDADTAFINQLSRAAVAVQSYCAGAGAGSTQCTNNASLGTSAQSFSTALQQVYIASALVPVGTSDIQAAIDSRSAGFKSALNSFAAISGSGVPAVTATGVVGAFGPLTTPQYQTLVTSDTLVGLLADSVNMIERWHVGDIEASAKVLLFDTFHGDQQARMTPHGINGRVAVGAAFRFPTGSTPDPNALLDVDAGTHSGAVGLRGYADLLLGSHFWTSIVARYDNPLGSDVTLRIPDSTGNGYLAAYRRATVHRTLGKMIEMEATPRWAFNDFVSLSLQYQYRHKAVDEYTGTPFTVGPTTQTGGATITIDPTLAGANTDLTEHRVGGGLSFSNARAASQGRGRIPFEAMYLHLQTVKGTGGYVPKLFVDEIQLRVYTKLFGR